MLGPVDGAAELPRQGVRDASMAERPIKSGRKPRDEGKTDAPSVPDRARPASKRTALIALLSKPDGATIDEMVAALGWLPHTTRAELTRLRHLGLSIARTPREKQASLYSLSAREATAAPAKVAAAA